MQGLKWFNPCNFKLLYVDLEKTFQFWMVLLVCNFILRLQFKMIAITSRGGCVYFGYIIWYSGLSHQHKGFPFRIHSTSPCGIVDVFSGFMVLSLTTAADERSEVIIHLYHVCVWGLLCVLETFSVMRVLLLWRIYWHCVGHEAHPAAVCDVSGGNKQLQAVVTTRQTRANKSYKKTLT